MTRFNLETTQVKKKCLFLYFIFYFRQQSSRMFGFDSDKKNFLCFSRITKHRETSVDSLSIMNHQKFCNINYEKMMISSMRALLIRQKVCLSSICTDFEAKIYNFLPFVLSKSLIRTLLMCRNSDFVFILKLPI